MNRNRLDAFSDGVFAIIITIMVLGLKIPKGDDWSCLESLLPVFLSYVMSFLFVGIYWVNHHHLLHAVNRVSTAIIWANLNLLFWLSLIPSATGWMGENRFKTNSVILYGIILILCGIAFTVLQKSVEKIAPELEQLNKAFSNMLKKGITSTIGYLIAILIAFINPVISEIIYVVATIIWLIPEKNIEHAFKSNKYDTNT